MEQSMEAKDAVLAQLTSSLEASAAAMDDLRHEHAAELESCAAAAAQGAKAELATVEAQAAVREGTLQRMGAELAAARDEAQALRAELEGERERVGSVESAAHASAAAAAEQAAAAAAAWRAETEDLRQQLASLQEKLEEERSAARGQCEGQEARLASERKIGEDKLKMVVDELRRVEGVKDDAEKQHARAQSEVEALRGRLQKREEEREQMESARAAREAERQKELKAKDLEIAELKAALAAGQVAAQSDEARALRAEAAHLQAQVEELINLRTGLEEAQVATLEEAAELKVRNRSLFIRNAHLEETMAGFQDAIAKVAAALGIDMQVHGQGQEQQVYSEEHLAALVSSVESAGSKVQALQEQLEAAAGAMEVSEEQRLEAQQAVQSLQDTLAAAEQKMESLQKALEAQQNAHAHVEAERVALEGKLEAMEVQLATAREQMRVLTEQLEALGRDAGASESEGERRLEQVQAQLADALEARDSKDVTIEALQQEHRGALEAVAALEASKEASEEELSLARTRQQEAEQLRDRALADVQRVEKALLEEQKKCKEANILNKALQKSFKKSLEEFISKSPNHLQPDSGTPAKPYYKDADAAVLDFNVTPRGKENSEEDAAYVGQAAAEGGLRKVLTQIEPNVKGNGVMRGATPGKGRVRAGRCSGSGSSSPSILSAGLSCDAGKGEDQDSGDTRVVTALPGEAVRS